MATVTSSFKTFNAFVEALAEGKHNFATNTIKVALTDALNAPSTTDDAKLADLVTVATTNLDTITVSVASSSQTGGVYKLVLQDLTMTASGSAGPFRYVVLYNDTALDKDLIAWFDNASEVTLTAPDTFKLDFGTELFSLTVSA